MRKYITEISDEDLQKEVNETLEGIALSKDLKQQKLEGLKEKYPNIYFFEKLNEVMCESIGLNKDILSNIYIYF
jgi:hypothetical protein